MRPKKQNGLNKTDLLYKAQAKKKRKTTEFKFQSSARVLSSIVFCVVLTVYVPTIYPSVPGGDSGELIIAAQEFGVAHPPGYPLFTVLSKLVQISSTSNPAWTTGLMCAGFGSATSALVFLLVHRLSGSVWSGVFSAFAFASTRTTWLWSITAEVFSLNNFFIALLLWITLRFAEHASDMGKHPGKMLYLGCFVGGLSLTNQHTIIVYVTCTALWVVMVLLKIKVLDQNTLWKMTTVFMLGLLPYIYLPISSYFRVSRSTWGDHTILTGFVKHLLRSQYGTLQLAHQNMGVADFTNNLSAHVLHCFDELTWPVVGLAVLGLVAGNRVLIQSAYHQPVMLWVAMMICYSICFAALANLDPTDPLLYGVVERFWIQSDIIICILAGIGLSAVTDDCNFGIKSTQNIFQSLWNRLRGLFGKTLVVGVLIFQVWRNRPLCDQSTNTVIRDFAINVIQSLPNNAIVIGKGDLCVNSMKYLILCEGLRSDLRFVDGEMMTFPWYLKQVGQPFLLQRGVVFPGDKYNIQPGLHADGSVAFDMKMFFDANKGQDIFTCIGLRTSDTSWKATYRLLPWGTCQRVVHMSEKFDIADYINRHVTISNWSLPYRLPDGHAMAQKVNFPWSSWERVASEEAWLAKGRAAFYFLNTAEEIRRLDGRLIKDREMWLTKQNELYYAAYKGFRMAIDNVRDAHGTKLGKPPYVTPPLPIEWHKYVALAAARCLEIYPDLKDYAEEAIKHFTIYLNLMKEYKEADGESSNIKKFIQRLETGLL